MKNGLRIFWWLPFYLCLLYWFTQYLDGVTFAPDDKWKAQVHLADKEATRTTGVIHLPAAGIPPDASLLIMNVSQNISITYPDGSILGKSGNMSNPIGRNKHRPLLYRLYQPALQTNAALPIELVSTRPKTLILDNVYIGPTAELEQAFRYNDLMRQGIVNVVIATLLVAAALIGSIWLFYPSRKEYLWYAIGTTLWASHSYINLIVRDVPIPDGWWAALIPLMIGLSVLSIVTMVYYYMPVGASGKRRHTRPLLYLWAAGAVLAMPLFFLASNPTWQATYQAFWHGLLAAIFSLVLAYVISLYWENQTIKRLLFVLCGFAMLVFGLHDIWVTEEGSPRPYLLHFAAMLTLLTQYFLLVRRFVSSLRETQYYAHHLEELVNEREQELEANYQKMHVMEQEKAVVDERERIMRDIHDGFGGHLVSTLAMLERPDARLPAIKANIQDALNDLRLVIDSLDFDSQEITTALGMFRSRNSRKIKQAGFDLRWAVEDIDTPAGFGAEKTLQLLRIVQEAITNSIKHSGGNSITVSTGTDASSGRSFVQIADNGHGIADTYQPGKGLASMRKRAERIGAHLTISPNLTSAGTAVRISLGINAPEPLLSQHTPA